MPKYLIERDLPGAGTLTQEQLGGVARKSCEVLRELGPAVQWVHSYVTDDKIYCVYLAPDEAAIREHARLGDFPVSAVSTVQSLIDPSTAE